MSDLIASDTTAPILQPPPVAKSNRRSFLDFKQSSGIIKNLISKFSKQQNQVETNRKIRYHRDVDVDSLKAEGKLLTDENIYPVKLVDTKIRQEQPQYIGYLTQSRRSVIFANLDGSEFPGSDRLESDFTNKCRFHGWEVPFIRCVDGFEANGWDSIEVVFDPSTPGNFAYEHIGNDRLIIPDDCENIQMLDILPVQKAVTSWQLDEMVEKFKFNSVVVNELKTKYSTGTDSFNYDQKTIAIYKIFFKESGIIYVAWYANESQQWLKEPEPLYIGCHDVTVEKQQVGVDEFGKPIMDYPPEYATDFPIFLFRYIESEDPKVMQIKGRCLLDKEYQMAVTAGLSGWINKLTRSANVYASSEATASNATPLSSPKITDTILKNGSMFDKPVNFFSLPAPESSLLTAIMQIMTISQQESSQVNYSALNRPDTEKTATEIAAATKESNKLSSVQVSLFSIALRSLFTYCWKIYQNRVAQGVIEVNPELLPLFVEIDPSTGKIIKLREYTIKSSGDVDVIQRAEKLDRMMKFWPVISATAAAQLFLADMLMSAFPEDANKYIKALGIAQQDKQLIGKLAGMVNTLATSNGRIRPELKGMEEQLKQILLEAQQSSGVPLQ